MANQGKPYLIEVWPQFMWDHKKLLSDPINGLFPGVSQVAYQPACFFVSETSSKPDDYPFTSF